LSGASSPRRLHNSLFWLRGGCFADLIAAEPELGRLTQ